jgi:hypothetical protein
VNNCNNIPDGKICPMHKSRWRKYKSYDLPVITPLINNQNHTDEILKICKKHGNLEHKNIYIVPKTGYKFCRLCQKERFRPIVSASDELRDKRLVLNEVWCGGCKKNKTSDSFTQGWLRKKNPYCIECAKYAARKSGLKKCFNMTIEDYDKLFTIQNGLCAICNKEETILHHSTKEKVKLSVDHNHQTNKIRGLLCTLCNFGIGYFKDSSELLRKAASYLESHEKAS